jgi:hypothetical protein
VLWVVLWFQLHEVGSSNFRKNFSVLESNIKEKPPPAETREFLAGDRWLEAVIGHLAWTINEYFRTHNHSGEPVNFFVMCHDAVDSTDQNETVVHGYSPSNEGDRGECQGETQELEGPRYRSVLLNQFGTLKRSEYGQEYNGGNSIVQSYQPVFSFENFHNVFSSVR